MGQKAAGSATLEAVGSRSVGAPGGPAAQSRPARAEEVQHMVQQPRPGALSVLSGRPSTPSFCAMELEMSSSMLSGFAGTDDLGGRS